MIECDEVDLGTLEDEEPQIPWRVIAVDLLYVPLDGAQSLSQSEFPNFNLSSPVAVCRPNLLRFFLGPDILLKLDSAVQEDERPFTALTGLSQACWCCLMRNKI